MKNPKCSVWHWPPAICLAAILVGVSSAQAAAAPRPHAWQRWEHTLTSARQHDIPYADVTLRVRYTGPDGRRLDGYGFWDGGQVFRIRCAFPAPGLWHWETECSDSSDTGLHGRRGTVEVASYRGENRLYQRGFLKVSQDRRYLVYGDGTPFLWMGDAAWAAPMRSNDDEWNKYLADRQAKHFTLILEAMYDGQGTNGWQAVGARSLAWRSESYGAAAVGPGRSTRSSRTLFFECLVDFPGSQAAS